MKIVINIKNINKKLLFKQNLIYVAMHQQHLKKKIVEMDKYNYCALSCFSILIREKRKPNNH